jgi:hypothetical protein
MELMISQQFVMYKKRFCGKSSEKFNQHLFKIPQYGISF